jgi:hypothetical protein
VYKCFGVRSRKRKTVIDINHTKFSREKHLWSENVMEKYEKTDANWYFHSAFINRLYHQLVTEWSWNLLVHLRQFISTVQWQTRDFNPVKLNVQRFNGSFQSIFTASEIFVHLSEITFSFIRSAFTSIASNRIENAGGKISCSWIFWIYFEFFIASFKCNLNFNREYR